jgi:hypothetical protein
MKRKPKEKKIKRKLIIPKPIEYYVVTPEIKKNLKTIAGNLPSYPKLRNGSPIPLSIQISGEQWLAYMKAPDFKGKKETKTSEGEEIKPKGRYTADIGYVMVDHYKELEKAWISKENPGIQDYINLAIEQNKAWIILEVQIKEKEAKPETI